MVKWEESGFASRAGERRKGPSRGEAKRWWRANKKWVGGPRLTARAPESRSRTFKPPSVPGPPRSSSKFYTGIGPILLPLGFLA